MTEEDEEDLKNMLDGIMHILTQQSIRISMIMRALQGAGIDVPMETIQ